MYVCICVKLHASSCMNLIKANLHKDSQMIHIQLARGFDSINIEMTATQHKHSWGLIEPSGTKDMTVIIIIFIIFLTVSGILGDV